MALLPEQISAVAHQQLNFSQALSNAALLGVEKLISLNLRYARLGFSQFQEQLNYWSQNAAQPLQEHDDPALPGLDALLDYGRELHQLSSEVSSSWFEQLSAQGDLQAGVPYQTLIELPLLPGVGKVVAEQLVLLPQTEPISKPAKAKVSTSNLVAPKPSAKPKTVTARAVPAPLKATPKATEPKVSATPVPVPAPAKETKETKTVAAATTALPETAGAAPKFPFPAAKLANTKTADKAAVAGKTKTAVKPAAATKTAKPTSKARSRTS